MLSRSARAIQSERWKHSASRLLVELLVVVALAEFAAMVLLPVVVHDGSTGKLGSLLDGLMVALLAGPAIYWRSLAAMQRTGSDAASARTRTFHRASMKSAVLMTAAAQMLGLAVTAAMVQRERQELQTEARHRFELGSERIEAEIKRRFNRPVYGLRGINGAFEARDVVSRSDFRSHIDLENLAGEYLGIYAFGYAQRVMRGDLPQFLAAVRSEGLPDFDVKTSGQNPELYVLKYVEPLLGHRGALGLDLAQETVRREAIERAIRSGAPTLSGRIKLVNDDKKGAAFLYLLPVYRRGTDPATPQQRQSAVLGILYTPIVVADILKGIAESSGEMLDLVLYAGDSVDTEEIIFDQDQHLKKNASEHDLAASEERLFVSRSQVVIGGQSFVLEVSSKPEFEASIKAGSFGISSVALIGTAASLLLAMTVWLLAVGRLRAQAIARGMSADLDRLALVVQHTSNAVVITDNQMRITWVNHGFTQISGYSSRQAMGRPRTELLSSGTADEQAVATLLTLQAQAQPCRSELLCRSRDGREYWLDADMQPLRDAKGTLIGFMEISIDVTEQRQVRQRLEAAIAETDALLRTVHLHAIVSVTNCDGEILEVNDAFCAISAFSREELIGQNHRILESRQQPREYWSQMWKTISAGAPWRGTICNRSKAGAFYWVDTMIAPIAGAAGTIDKYVCISFDISASRDSQRLLKEQSDRLTLAIEGTSDGLWDWLDLSGDAQWWSPGYYALIGYAPDELEATASNFLALLHPDFVEACRKDIADAFAGKKVFDREYLLRTKAGEYRWFHARAKVYQDHLGRPIRIAGATQDIHDRKLAERGLAREQRRLADILEGTHVGTWEWNIETGEVHFNERWAEIIGFKLEELGPTTVELWNSRVHPDDLVRARALVDRHCRGETPYYEHEVRMLHKLGHWVWVLSRGKLTSRNEDGSPRWMAGTHTDISERKHAEVEIKRSADLLRAAIEVIDEAFVLFDPDDRLVYCNDKYREVYSSLSDLTVPGTSFETLVRAGAERGVLGHTMASVDEWVAERVAAHRGGATREVQRIDDGRIVRIIERRLPDGHTVGFRIDLTELVRATEAAQEASRSKSQFLANMSHEIRTPMSAILGMLKLLQSTELTATQLDYAAKTESAARSLLGLLDDILDFSKVEAGKMALDMRPFSIERMLRDLSVILAANVGNKNIELLYDIDTTVPTSLLGDDMRLQQVLINLGSNAIKFTPQGEVTLHIRVAERVDREVLLEFSVRDTGIGIAPEHQSRIFGGFSQAEASTTRRFGGSGLGLAISQRLVQLMGGELQFNSVPDRGSNFYFQAWFALAENESVGSDGKTLVVPARETGPMHALIVDDSAMVREHLSRMVKTLDWRVDVAASAAQAIAMTQERSRAGDPYQVILVDLHLSDMDGWELCRRIRALEEDGSVVPSLLLMLPSYAQGMQTHLSHEGTSDVNGFLVKPFTVSMLAEAVTARSVAKTEPEHKSRAVSSISKRDRLAGLRVLLMEDNAINQQIVQKLLEEEGAYVALADNGALGVAAVANANPQFDVVLMDLQMPVMDGLTATRHIRKELGLASLPIIAMTANVMASDREACMAAGMNDHVGKPFDLVKLVAILQRYARPVENAVLAKRLESTLRRPSHGLPAELLADAQSRGVQLEEALARMGGNTGVYRRMLHSFIADLSTKHDELEDLLRRGKRQEAGRLMHTLKGLASTLGVQALSSLSAQLEEKLAGPERRDQHRTLLLDLENQIETSVLDVTRIAKALDEATRAPRIDAKPASNARSSEARSLQESLEELMALLRSADMRAVDVYEQLRSQHAQTFAKSFQALDKSMTELDFEAARVECMTMMKGASA